MSRIVYRNGVPFVEMNGEEISPAAFRSFRPRPDNIALFSRAGVRLDQMIVTGINNTMNVKYSLFGEVWKGDGVYDFAPFDRQMKMFRDFAPDGLINVMLPLDTRDWWLAKHPEVPDSFKNLGQAAASEEWRRDAAEYLKAFIRYSEEKYGDVVYAYSISAGTATEWFANDKGQSAPIKEAAYRKWLGDENASIPDEDELNAGERSLRGKDSPGYKYLEFSSELTADLVCFFAAEAQKELRHRKLLGMFYGYIAISTPAIQNLWLTNGYERAWRSPDIDMLYSPAAYGENRRYDGYASYQVCVDSIAANGKLYLHEIDHRTHLARYPVETGAIMSDCYSTAGETIQALRRELCSAMVKNSSFWWFDFYGGYYSSPEYEEELRLENGVYASLAASAAGERRQLAEIAVFVDPMSFLNIKEKTENHRTLGKNCVNELIHCGAPIELYNLSDLPRLDTDKYKLFVFLNAINISDDVRAVLDEKLADAHKFFLYGADSASGGSGIDFARTAKLCGMKLAEFEAPENPKLRRGDVAYGFDRAMYPMLEVVDPEAEILGDFDGGRHGLAYMARTKTFFSAAGNVPWQVWRDVAERAGVHLYTRQGYGLFVCTQFAAAYTVSTDAPELDLPDSFTGGGDVMLEELFEGGTVCTEGGKLRWHAKPGHIRLFVKK